MKNSHIEWTDHTFNPWIGCAKVSPGCAHCYAETLNFRWHQGKNWGKGKPRARTSESNWRHPLAWNAEAAKMEQAFASRSGPGLCAYRKPRVFCASLADWLDDEVPIEWLADLLKLIHATPHLDWLLLTKRPENWYVRLRDALAHIEGIDPITGWDSVDPLSDVGDWLNEWLGGNKIPGNVWIGVSVEDNSRAKERHPLLMQIPARVHFWSAEPLLENLDALPLWEKHGEPDWVICGGESGPGARPMHPEWPRRLGNLCQAAGVAFFFKQWGEYVRDADIHKGHERNVLVHDGVTLDDHGNAAALGYRRMYLVGKKAAGRLLHGREWNEFPHEEVAK